MTTDDIGRDRELFSMDRTEEERPAFRLGDLVKKRGNRGQWHGRICGVYGTGITPEGYAVESLLEPGSVQIYPASALEPWDGDVLALPHIAAALADRFGEDV